MLLWLMPVAFAGTAVEEMDAIALARQPALAVACSPSAAVYQSLQGLFQLPFVSSRLGAVAGPELVLLTSPEQLRALGVADDGVWSAVMAPQELSLTLPFHGSADQAKALLTALAGPDGVHNTREGWALEGGKLSGEARQDKDALLVDVDAPWARLPGAPARPELLSGLPKEDGCVVYVSVANAPGKIPFDGAVVQVPMEGDLVRIRAHGKSPPPKSLRQRGGRMPKLATVQAPDAVLVANLDVLDLMSEMPGDTFSEKDRADLERLRRRISMGPGVAMGYYNDGQRFVAHVPVRGRLGIKVSRRHIRAAVKTMEPKTVWSDKDHFSRQTGTKVLYGEVRRGQVNLGTEPTLLAELAEGKGQPWGSDALGDWLKEYPLVFEVGHFDVKGVTIGGDRPMRFGLGATDDVWTAQLDLPPGALGAQEQSLGGRRRGDPDFKMGARQLQPRDEVNDNINGIYIAELAYYAAFDGYVPALPAPRSQAQLNAEPTAWGPTEGFSTLGWSPDGPVQGVYWVEVSADGHSFTVFASIDADGDGVPARYQRVVDQEIERLTPPEVR